MSGGVWRKCSSSPISTNKALSLLRALFVEIRACRACASPSQPQSAALTATSRGMRPAPSAPAGGSAASRVSLTSEKRSGQEG